MKLKIIAVGKIKDHNLNNLIDFYSKQIPNLEIIEINDEALLENVKNEENSILKLVKKSDYVIALAIEGKTFDSVEFASKIDNILTNQSSTITFIIGGSWGLTKKIKDEANLLLSFSKFTFPHQLMRLILVEQIFRATTILKNHPYHK